MLRTILCIILATLVFSWDCPLYKQCDPRWGGEQLGFASSTICSDGCAVSSVAMALACIGQGFDPSSLNQWLKGHGGFVNGDWIVWGSVAPVGLAFRGNSELN